MTRALSVFAAAVAVALAVPEIDIDLDLIPEVRFANVSKHFAKEIRPMFNQWETVLGQHMTPKVYKDWATTIEVAEMDFDDYYRELKGIVGFMLKPEDNPSKMMMSLLLFQAVYELNYPQFKACSGLLFADPKGRVIHGRNLDYSMPFQMPEGQTLDFPEVTYTGRYWKGGKLVFQAPSFLLYTGIHTAMRMDGWTFEQNTRPGNDMDMNLRALKDNKGDIFGWRARRIMETTPHFSDALAKFSTSKFIAPMYLILSGAGPYEGAVISVDRGDEHLEETPPVQLLSKDNNTWYLLQTNDDANKPPMDTRRPMTKVLLTMENQSDVDEEFVWKNIRSPTLVVPDTIITMVASPQTGYYQVLTRTEAAAATAKLVQEATPAAAQALSVAKRVGHTKWARRALLAHAGAGEGP